MVGSPLGFLNAFLLLLQHLFPTMFLLLLSSPSTIHQPAQSPPRHAGVHHVQVAAGAQLVDDATAAVEVADDVSWKSQGCKKIVLG